MQKNSIENFTLDPDLEGFYDSLKNKSTVKTLKQSLLKTHKHLKNRFIQNDDIRSLIHLHSIITDLTIQYLWENNNLNKYPNITLVAVGGYGRAELHPHSDIDIMILLKDKSNTEINTNISLFLTNLWDLGFDLGHSVRTINECIVESKKDLTVITTLMESRAISGEKELFQLMKDSIKPNLLWSSKDFFISKTNEQAQRHLHSSNAANKLEPNIKLSPGGLRDIQLINWVAKRHFQINELSELINHNLLTKGQLKILHEGQSFLWRIRYGLHIIVQRREDRLLFDYQKRLASILGYEDATFMLGVEQMMQRYYRTVMDLSRINEMILQQFEELILASKKSFPIKVNASFQIKNNYLEAINDHIFKDNPSALLELFLLLQKNSNLKGVSANTIGLIKRNLHLINDEFRQQPKNHRLFLNIIKAPEGVTHELRRMNLYGVLGLYIPAFGRIVGRMQYDLFHAYTVDEHTLNVVSNLRRFSLTRFDNEYPHCSKIMQSLKNHEIIYLAGLFHDIAKGRGGDHSELGASDARTFCLEHAMEEDSAEVVAWLVKYHLLFSMTAQKKDISDPIVIKEFTNIVGNNLRLDYLYILTVADIRGTNPDLWNSWKENLFYDLYIATKNALKNKLEDPEDHNNLILIKKTKSKKILSAIPISNEKILTIWKLHTDEYFIRYKPNEIAWHTEQLHKNNTNKFINIRQQEGADSIQIAICAPQSMQTFAATTGILDELGMNIVDARIVPMKNDHSIDTYVFIDKDINKITKKTTQILEDKLASLIEQSNLDIHVSRRPLRITKHFSTKPELIFKKDSPNNRTILEVVTKDEPGLLSKIGQVFKNLNINIQTAKIVTIGERAEDVFFIVNKNNQVLSKALIAKLKNNLMEYIGS